jgi:hypothetical protein
MKSVILAAGIGLILLLVSCLGVESGITLNDNGSGKLAFQYRISKMFTSLEKNEAEADRPELPLPVSKQDLEQSLAKVKGVTLTGAEQTETDTDIVLKGEIRFDSVAALNKSGLFDDMPVVLSKEGGQTVFTQLIADAREPLDQETLDAYRQFFDGYEIVLKVTAPKAIVSPAPEHGEFSADKRTLTYRISLMDWMRLSEKTVLRVAW